MKLNFFSTSLIGFLFFVICSTACRDDIVESRNNTYNSLRVVLNPSLELQTRNELAESQVTNLYAMVFDENGILETRLIQETVSSEIVFSKLSAGSKTLFILGNIGANGYRTVPGQLEDVATLTELKALLLTHSSAVVHAPQVLPMTHFQELSIPMANPSIEVDLTREVVRLVVENDLYNDEISVVDSICFRGLTKESALFDQEGHAISVDSTSVILQDDTSLHTFYLLPVVGGQVSYTVFWKDRLGVTKLNKGRIAPKLDKNNSYRLKLSTGEIVDIGIPSDVKVTIDPLLGTYSVRDTTIQIMANGGAFKVASLSFDQVGIGYSTSWLTDADMTRAVKKEFEYSVSVTPFVDSDEVRTGYITLYNKLDPTKQFRINVIQQGENRGPKYIVVVVSGQSNSIGWDRTPPDLTGIDALHPRAFQLGEIGYDDHSPYVYHRDSSNLNIVPLHYVPQHLLSKRDVNTGIATKGIHLPLAKELIKRIPDDYNVIVIAASGTSFTTGELPGSYDPTWLRAVDYAAPNLQYGFHPTGGVIVNLIKDRIKYVLDKNKRNRFAGIVWVQGEADANRGNIPEHSELVQKMFSTIFSSLNENGKYSSQLPNGIADSRLWFTHTSCGGWYRWHNQSKGNYSTGSLFGGYKVLNPRNYIHIPPGTKHDLTQDQGDSLHFGRNAYSEVVAPMVAERMDINGVLFNGRSPAPLEHFFERNMSQHEMLEKTGSFEDPDIQNGLLIALPFDRADDITYTPPPMTMLPNKIVNHGAVLMPAHDLKDSSGKDRKRLALELSVKGGGYISLTLPALNAGNWSASFMLRRKGGKGRLSKQFVWGEANSNLGFFYERYGKESTAGYLELAFQPANRAKSRLSSVIGRIHDADYVRDIEQWIHYAVSYNHSTRRCSMYMNGQLTMSEVLEAGRPVPNITSLQINDPVEGVDAQLMDLYIWNREVSANTLFKTYIMSYYGLYK